MATARLSLTFHPASVAADHPGESDQRAAQGAGCRGDAGVHVCGEMGPDSDPLQPPLRAVPGLQLLRAPGAGCFLTKPLRATAAVWRGRRPAAAAELAFLASWLARGHWLMCVLLCAHADTLVQHLQQLHDGAVPDGAGRHDPAAHAQAGLCAVSILTAAWCWRAGVH